MFRRHFLDKLRDLFQVGDIKDFASDFSGMLGCKGVELFLPTTDGNYVRPSLGIFLSQCEADSCPRSEVVTLGSRCTRRSADEEDFLVRSRHRNWLARVLPT